MDLFDPKPELHRLHGKSYFDEIAEVRVIGGEPFMNKDFDKIIEMLNVKVKIMRQNQYQQDSDLQIQKYLGFGC